MGTAVRNLDDVLKLLETVPEEGRLFCIILFDDRNSHKVVRDFIDENLIWLDSLSATSHIFTLVFSEKWTTYKNPPAWLWSERPRTIKEEKILKKLKKELVYRNPSLQIASMFGIQSRSLPGLVIFETLSDQTTGKAIYVPMEIDLFKDDTKMAENLLADIYSIIQESFDANKGKDKAQFISDARQRLRRHQDKERQKSQLSTIADKLEPLAELTQKFGVALAEALAGAVVKKW